MSRDGKTRVEKIRVTKLDVVGIHEIAAHINVKKQRAFTYSQMIDFPDPAAELAQGRIWHRRDVETFFRNRGRDW